MNVLIIGGSGFLSGTMARHALGAGHTVWAVTRGQRPMPAGAQAIVADRKDRAAFASAIADAKMTWDIVIDCIGFTADDARQDVEVFAGRTPTLVFISTDSVFDPCTFSTADRPAFDRPWKLDESFDRYDTISAYGLGKREAELVLIEGMNAAAGRGTAITILRPCHIYGPGSQLGCLPTHGRDPELIAKLKRGEPLKLVGGGYFLQQPIAAKDLAMTAISCHGNPRAAGQTYMTAGPDVVASREYYRIIADVLGVPLTVEEVSITEQLAANPNQRNFFCHRVYSMDKAARDGLHVPATPLREGLAEHVRSML